MMKNMLNKYINWVDSTGWKTFFKVYGLAVLYFFVICLIRSDGFGVCIIVFPFDPLDSFIAPFLRILELCNIASPDRTEDMIAAIYVLLLSGLLINIYHFGKKESSFRQKALILSQIIKLGLVSYLIVIIIFYAYLWISGGWCNHTTCGFLMGYY